jgi:rare lipoprotein A
VKTSVDTFFSLKKYGLRLKIAFLVSLLAISCAPAKRPSSVDYQPSAEAKRGVASWYGAEFHGRPTASGEIYNMYDYTCAHREYPFGTRLKVTNLKNGKDVVCTVNDRGPFVPGRDLDLSYASARKIDLIGLGITEVLMEPIGRDLAYVRYVKYSPINGQLTIQVGAFREIENAQRLKEALSLNYKNVYIIKASVKGEVFYRVRVGKYRSYDEAYGVAKAMGQEGYRVLITNFEGGLRDEI